MKKNSGNIFIIILTMLALFVATVSIASADPTVDNIETDPETPKILSTFKVIATVTGDNIMSITVTVSECSDSPDQCYIAHTDIPMTLNADGKYEAEITLEDDKDRSDHVQYQFVIDEDGVEYTLNEDDWKTYLDTSPSNGNGQTNDDGGDNGSPGFELALVLIAVLIGVSLYRKKR